MLADQIISTGLEYLGTPYVFNSPSYQTDTFDCSSFIQYIFGVNGIPLPRTSREQAKAGIRISFDQIQKGDLLFFTTKTRKNGKSLSKIGHVGLYIGNGQMLHTYRQGKKVRISELNSYWKTAFVAAKRVLS
ncbi:C40 family peptidase [Priestia abyssalis]|uniref:C40 family peptidase n=1 Tax=Priestia abyssalis TaxID=1221450 RepID=UPI0014766456|nr:C40 family peptidase [Priestia abyssalis]